MKYLADATDFAKAWKKTQAEEVLLIVFFLLRLCCAAALCCDLLKFYNNLAFENCFFGSLIGIRDCISQSGKFSVSGSSKCPYSKVLTRNRYREQGELQYEPDVP